MAVVLGALLPSCKESSLGDGVPAERGCNSCHGSADNPAPPLPAAVDKTLGTRDVQVGAHQVHVHASLVSGAPACSECHVVPDRIEAPGHVDLPPAEVRFGELASSGGAVPTWDRSTATCSVYCHGSTLTGGTRTHPVWTYDQLPAYATTLGPETCVGCHGAPPPPPHPKSTGCVWCHPMTALADGSIDLAGDRHIDGRTDMDMSGAGCGDCHGVPPASGAHLAHYGDASTPPLAVYGDLRSMLDYYPGGVDYYMFGCGDCHSTNGADHMDGLVEVTLHDPAAPPGSLKALNPPEAAFAGGTCASVYCHSSGPPWSPAYDPATDPGASPTYATTPAWDGGHLAAPCADCHELPPPAPHPQDADCYVCHPDTAAPDGSVLLSRGRHVDGEVEIGGGEGACGECHTVPPSSGAHLAHYGDTSTPPLARYGDLGTLLDYHPEGFDSYVFGCGNCHPTREAEHMDDRVEVALFDPGAPAGSLKHLNPAGAWYAGGSCGDVYCHGNGNAEAMTYATTPAWVGGTLASPTCVRCHAAPPPAPHPPVTDCAMCHADTAASDGTVIIANGKHVDGKVETTGGACGSCHAVPPATGAHVAHYGDSTYPPLVAYGDLGTLVDYYPGGAGYYMFGCGNCHPTDGTEHMDGALEVELFDPGAAPDSLKALNPRGAWYVNGRCGDVYCHSNGNASAMTYAMTPDWVGGTLGTPECAQCHLAPPPSPHPRIGTCSTCHPETAAPDGSVIVANGKHVDGRVEGVGGECGACHAVPPATGAHVAHYGDASVPPVALYGDLRTLIDFYPGGVGYYMFGCGNCHPTDGTEHMDGSLEVELFDPGAPAGSLKALNPRGAWYVNGRCGDVYCHSNGNASAMTYAMTPDWVGGTLGTPECAQCHLAPPPSPHPQTGTCSACHPETAAPDGSVIVANGKHVNGTVDGGGGECGACHAVPPPTGAHVAHYGDTSVPPVALYGDLRTLIDYYPGGVGYYMFGCGNCHPTDGTEHMDGSLEVELFDPGAPAGSLKALNPRGAWYVNGRCGDVYCHSNGNASATTYAMTPDWVGGTLGTPECAQCHLAPPPSPHPQTGTCSACHPETAAPDGSVIVANGKHVNGTVDGGGGECGACHAVPPATGAHVAHYGDTSVPPLAAYGDLGTLVDYYPGGVGYYMFGCGNCHPTDGTEHMDGALEVALYEAGVASGTLKALNPTTAAFSGGSCSDVYCHSNGNASATVYATTPAWAGGTLGTPECVQCHLAPPPSPHPQNTLCAGCHGETAAPDGSVIIANGKHVNGRVDGGGGECGACHAVPPATGAHVAHYGDTSVPPLAAYGDLGTLVDYYPGGVGYYMFGCGNCHPTDGTEHMDGTLEVALYEAGVASGTLKALNPSTATFSGGSCSDVYCHSNGNASATTYATTPAWAGGTLGTPECVQCHLAPPPSPHPQNTLCAGCHGETAAPDGSVIVANGKHVNGRVNGGGGECGACHAVPPATGAHVAHYGDTSVPPLAAYGDLGTLVDYYPGGVDYYMFGCGNCHPTDGTEHMDGTLEVALYEAGVQAGTLKALNPPGAWYVNGRCGDVYCHSNGNLSASTYATTPDWVGGTLGTPGCAQCHLAPPPEPHPQTGSCSSCHPDTAAADGSVIIANGKHVNGTVESSGGECGACHAVPPATGAHVAHYGDTSVPPLALYGDLRTLIDYYPGGVGYYMFGCGNCHPTDGTEHMDGALEVALYESGVASGTVKALNPSTATFSGGSCSDVYCHSSGNASAMTYATTPAWVGGVLGTPECAQCHLAPPPEPHPQTGSCSSCHPDTAAADGSVIIANGKHVNGTVEGGGGECGACHAVPPATGAHVAHYGDTSVPPLALYGDLRTLIDYYPGGVGYYMFGCGNCHPTDGTEHMDGTLEVALYEAGVASGTLKALNPSTATFSGGSCSDVYCHSNGNASAMTYATTPAWVGGVLGTPECAQCHLAPPPEPHPQTGSCSSCHPDTAAADGSVIIANGKHVNGTVEGGGGECGACHAVPPATGAHVAHYGDTSVPPLALYGDLRTLIDYYPGGVGYYMFGCGNCHPTDGTEHMDGTLEVALYEAGVASGTLKALNPSTAAFSGGSCSDVYCHSNGNASATTYATTPAWVGGALGTPECAQCHLAPPPEPHPQNVLCSACHPDTAAADGSVIIASGKHVNGSVEGGGAGCGGCHAVPPSTGAHVAHYGDASVPPLALYGDLRTLIDYYPGGVAYYMFGCGNCHPTDGTEHMDGTLEVALYEAGVATDTLKALNPATASYAAGSCADVYCHSNGDASAMTYATTPEWSGGALATPECAQCHLAPPPPPHPPNTLCAACHPETAADDGSVIIANGTHVNGSVEGGGAGCGDCHAVPPATGAHVAHYGDTSVPPLALYGDLRTLIDFYPGGVAYYMFGCGNCHPTAGTEHMDGSLEVALYEAAVPAGTIKALNPATASYAAGSCADVYCHSNGNASAMTYATTPAWEGGALGTPACAQCHLAPPPPPHPPNALCAACHPETAAGDGSVIIANGKHVNGTVDGGGGECGSCHAVPPATGAHAAHYGDTSVPPLAQYGDLGTLIDYYPGGVGYYMFGCGNCHPTDGAEHMDGTLEVALYEAGVQAGTLKALNPSTAAFAGGTCSNVYCHSSGDDTAITYVTTPAWAGGVLPTPECAQCHGYPPTTTHPGNANCVGCHPQTATSDGSVIISNGTHVNGTVDF